MLADEYALTAVHSGCLVLVKLLFMNYTTHSPTCCLLSLDPYALRLYLGSTGSRLATQILWALIKAGVLIKRNIISLTIAGAKKLSFKAGL